MLYIFKKIKIKPLVEKFLLQKEPNKKLIEITKNHTIKIKLKI